MPQMIYFLHYPPCRTPKIKSKPKNLGLKLKSGPAGCYKQYQTDAGIKRGPDEMRDGCMAYDT